MAGEDENTRQNSIQNSGQNSKLHRGLYMALLLLLFVAVGALITGKIAANTREAKEKAQADQKLIDKYTAEAAELSAHIAEVKNEITGIDTRYRQVLGRLKETDREFYNLYDMYSRSLETDRVLAGLTTVSGSGIVIRLDDSGLVQSLVHDSYLSEILNVLKSAGAQAISINGERIVPTSEVLCLGPSIRVNGVRLFAPYRIAAVGEPDTLLKAYQESRIYSTIVAQNLLYDVQKYDSLTIGAYTGDPNKQITKLY